MFIYQKTSCQDFTQIIIADYQPPLGLPNICLTIKDGRLLGLDWWQDKTTQLLYAIDKKINTTSVETIAVRWLSFLNKDNPNQQKINDNPNCSTSQNSLALQNIVQQLDEYFAHKRQYFDIPLDLSYGTAFQQMVWQTLQTIDYGHTISYKQLAQKLGRPTAFRACANANGKNPISLIVPCHRVIASDGGLGGYTGGTDIKRILLEHEQGWR